MVERNLNVALNEEIAPSVQAVNVISGAKHKVIAQYYNNGSASHQYDLNTNIACNRYKLVSLVCYATEEDFGGATVTVTAYKGVPMNGVNTDFAVATESLVVPAVTAGTFEKVTSSIGEADDTDSMRFSGTIEVAAGGKVTLEAVYRNANDNAIETIQGAVAEIADNTSIQQPYRLLEVDSDGVLRNNTTTKKKIDISGATTMQAMVLAFAFADDNEIEGAIDLSSIISLPNERTLFRAFQNTKITSVDLSSLEYVGNTSTMQFCFSGCTALKYLDFPELVSVSGTSVMGQLASKSGVEVVRFPKLATISGGNALLQVFLSCTSLTDVYFNALKTTSFGSTTNQFTNMFSGDTDVKLHFPSNLTATIAGLDTYPNFGGTNTQVLFDLPATE